MARKSEQEHAGSAGSGDPAVEYGYSLTGTTWVEFRAGFRYLSQHRRNAG
jgi:hypothetical protein